MPRLGLETGEPLAFKGLSQFSQKHRCEGQCELKSSALLGYSGCERPLRRAQCGARGELEVNFTIEIEFAGCQLGGDMQQIDLMSENKKHNIYFHPNIGGYRSHATNRKSLFNQTDLRQTKPYHCDLTHLLKHHYFHLQNRKKIIPNSQSFGEDYMR